MQVFEVGITTGSDHESFDLGYGSLVSIKPLLRKFRHLDEIFLKINHAENTSKIEFDLDTVHWSV